MRVLADTNVFIAAFRIDDAAREAAALNALSHNQLLDSACLRLEPCPTPLRGSLDDEIAFYDLALDGSVEIASNDEVRTTAFHPACRYGAHPRDSLLVATAVIAGADAFVSFGKPNSPTFGVTALHVMQP